MGGLSFQLYSVLKSLFHLSSGRLSSCFDAMPSTECTLLTPNVRCVFNLNTIFPNTVCCLSIRSFSEDSSAQYVLSFTRLSLTVAYLSVLM